MNTKSIIAASTLLGTLALAATQASAAPAGPMAAGFEKCYGVAAAGKNDCASGFCTLFIRRLRDTLSNSLWKEFGNNFWTPRMIPVCVSSAT